MRIVRTFIPLLLGATLVAGCKGQGQAQGNAGKPVRERPAVAVTLASVAREDIDATVALTGTLAAERQVAVAARISGRVTEIPVELGDPVRKGQVIARLDASELQARVAQVEAAIASQQATLRQRQIDHANLARQAGRDKQLLAQDFIARQDYESSQARADGAQALISLAQAEIARQQATLREARTALAQAVLTAPADGIVSERHLDPGSVVSPGAPVVSLVGRGNLKAVVQVSEQVLPKLKPGGPATIRVDAWPQATFAAKVRRIAPAVTPDTRTAAVELAVSDAEGQLRPGMFARVGLSLERRAGVATVPRQAVVTRDGATGLFVAEEGKARFVPVTLGVTSEAQAELLSGPPAGTPVITLGNHQLTDGTPVRPEGEQSAKGADGPKGEGR